MAMSKNEVLASAIESINFDMEESYDECEADDPSVADWMDKKREVIAVLEGLKDE